MIHLNIKRLISICMFYLYKYSNFTFRLVYRSLLLVLIYSFPMLSVSIDVCVLVVVVVFA